MRTTASRRAVGFLGLALATAGLVVMSSAATAAAVTFDLCATTGNVTLPGPTPADPDVSVPIWGFALPSGGSCNAGTATLPGPQLEAAATDTVTVVVHNLLPAGHTPEFEVPGLSPTNEQTGVDSDANPTVSVTFAAADAGTYLYQSSGDAGRQTAMGMYGALIVRPATAGQAYGPSTPFDTEAVLVLSALDPLFNQTADPNTFNMNDYTATYWMINGKSYPDTLPGIAATPGQRLLLRYLNAGFDNTTMALLGTHEQVVARDAHLLPQAFDAVAETIPAGATEDAIVTMPSTAPPADGGFPLYNRQLHLTNGTLTGPTPTPGGMLTFIHP